METIQQLSQETGIPTSKVTMFFRTAFYSDLVMRKVIDYRKYDDLKKVLIAYFR
jgi:hypothetical protein